MHQILFYFQHFFFIYVEVIIFGIFDESKIKTYFVITNSSKTDTSI